MITRIKFLRRLFLYLFPLLLSAKIAVAAVPVESSHYNSNTYTNLNTLTSTGTITFTIAYDSAGDIKWYKDNVLVQTNTSTTTASLTTAWTSGDYGMVRQMRVNATNADGASNDTIWNAEVQRTGTATISKNSHPYHPPTLDYKPTLYITSGWTDLPSLYLAAKQEDNAWIEYVSAKTYLVKAGIWSAGAALYITTDTVNEVRIQGVSPSPGYRVNMQVSGGGTLKIDKVKLYGWDIVNDREITLNDVSPSIISNGNNQLDISDSDLRHVRVHLKGDKSPGDVIDNNLFYEGNPSAMYVLDPNNPVNGGSEAQIISNNAFINSKTNNYSANRNWDTAGIILQNNRFIFPYGSTGVSENVLLGKGTAFVGNEVIYSQWNLIEYPERTFSRYSNLHDNGGYHNGFNGMWNYSYSVNDYCHHFTGFNAFYIQVGQPDVNDRSTWIWPHDIYILNACTNNAGGINILGGSNIYVYNYTPYNSGLNAEYSSDHIVIRKSSFLKAEMSGVSLTDLFVDDYGYVGNAYVIDSVFTEQNREDYRINSKPEYGGNPVIYSINSFRKHSSSGTITIPVFKTYADATYNGEVRNYAWLDTLVQDTGGNPVSGATVTVEPLTDASYPAINVLLPPPPPDLNEYPAEQLPIPSTATFTSVTTGADGHTPLPNYGWSANTEPTPALLFYRQKSGNVNFSTYSYRITATYNSQSVSKDVTPDVSWYREDPCQAAKTVVFTFDKPAGKYALNVNGGTGSGLYSQGESVNIAAGSAPSGKVFDKWIGDTTTVNDVNSASTYIVVPSSDISVTAYFKDITYHLTVAGGTGSGDYPAGSIAVVNASSATATQVFYKWTGDTEHVVSPTVYSSTLIMPAHDATVTAAYRYPTSYSCRLTVADGEGTDFYAPGDNVTITAAAAPSGKVFDHWEGDTASLADAGSSNTTLTGMPDDYLIVYPVYRASGLTSSDANLSNLAVSGGTVYPRFASYASGYAGIVGINVNNVTITPVASQGGRAAITVNGLPVNSGSASAPISLNATGSTMITVVVTAPDATTTKTYTVSVTRTLLATGYTLTAPNPASGEVNAASGYFTVTPNGKYTGTITITPSGGGLSTPLNLTFTNSDEPRTFTITPVAAGRVTLTPTNNGGLTDPAAVTYTAYMPGTLRNACRTYPNPADFSKVSRATIVYTVADESAVTVRIYTIAGELVKTLVNNEARATGEYTVNWQGDTDSGRKAASGIYFCIASIGNDIIKKKIAVIR